MQLLVKFLWRWRAWTSYQERWVSFYGIRLHFYFLILSFLMEEIENFHTGLIAIAYRHMKIENNQIVIFLLVKLSHHKIKSLEPVHCLIYLTVPRYFKLKSHHLQLHGLVIGNQNVENLVTFIFLYLLVKIIWNLVFVIFFVNVFINRNVFYIFRIWTSTTKTIISNHNTFWFLNYITTSRENIWNTIHHKTLRRINHIIICFVLSFNGWIQSFHEFDWSSDFI